MKDLLFENFDTLALDVFVEHQKQIIKWGIQDHDISWWLVFLTEEVGELSKAICEHHFRVGSKEDIYKEAIQVATLALKIAEMIGQENEIKKN